MRTGAEEDKNSDKRKLSCGNSRKQIERQHGKRSEPKIGISQPPGIDVGMLV